MSESSNKPAASPEVSRPLATPVSDPTTLDASEELALSPAPRRRRFGSASGLTSDGRLRSGKLAGLTMWSAIWVLSWPILAESYLNSLVGLTDTVLAARISEAATDAIGAASYILWFVGLIAMAISVGATALVSRAVGAGRLAVANAATGQAMLLGAIGGVLTGALLIAMAKPLVAVYGLSGETAEAFGSYLRILGVGVPAMTIVASGIACARGAGDSVRPLLSMVAVNFVNIAASWALSGVAITGDVGDRNGIGLNWGVSGIAWGTVLGEYVGALVVLLILQRGSAGVRLMSHRLKPHWHTLRRLGRVGFINFLETFGMWMANFAVVLMVRWLAVGGSESSTLGAHIVAIRIEAFSYLPGFAIGAAAATLAGQYLGAGSPTAATRAIWRCIWVASSITGVMGLAFIIMPRTIVGWVSPLESHLAICPTLLVYAGLVQVPFGACNVMRSALRGAGDVKWVMVLTWISTYAIRLPLAYALSGVDLPIPLWLGGGTIQNPFRDTPSLAGLWAGLCIEIVMRCVLFGARFLHGGWAKSRV